MEDSQNPEAWTVLENKANLSEIITEQFNMMLSLPASHTIQAL